MNVINKEKVLQDIVTMLCNDFVDTILVGIEECEQYFTYTIACTNFITELREKNIIVDFNDIFIDTVRDKLYRETSNYLAK